MLRIVRFANSGKPLLAALVLNLLVVSTIFSLEEHTGLLKSMYWAMETGWTLGQGDVLGKAAISHGLTVYTFVSFWFLLLLVSAKVITTLILDADKFTHEEQEQLKKDLAETRTVLVDTNAKLAILIENLLTHEEQTRIMTQLDTLTHDILSSDEQQHIMRRLDELTQRTDSPKKTWLTRVIIGLKRRLRPTR